MTSMILTFYQVNRIRVTSGVPMLSISQFSHIHLSFPFLFPISPSNLPCVVSTLSPLFSTFYFLPSLISYINRPRYSFLHPHSSLQCLPTSYRTSLVVDSERYRIPSHRSTVTSSVQVSRQMFHLSGTPFEDHRVTMEDWPKYKDSESVPSSDPMDYRIVAATPFGQMPVLFVDGKPLPQSFAIARYLANLFGTNSFLHHQSFVNDSHGVVKQFARDNVVRWSQSLHFPLPPFPLTLWPSYFGGHKRATHTFVCMERRDREERERERE